MVQVFESHTSAHKLIHTGTFKSALQLLPFSFDQLVIYFYAFVYALTLFPLYTAALIVLSCND